MTLFRFPALAALLLVPALALIPASARADSLQEANRLFKQGQFAPALEKTELALAAKPRDAQARFLKGLILTELNRQNDAIAVFTKLTEDYPELPEPYNNLAVLYAQQRQYEKAKNALEMAIRTHPSYATAHENLGDIYARMASQAYDKALQLDSSNASAQTKLAMIRDLMGTSGRPTMVAAKNSGKTQVAAAPAAAKPEAAPPVADSKPADPKPVETKPAAEKPAEAKPVPVAAPESKPAAAGGRQEIEKTVHNWAAAWSKKDVKAYLGFYARDFQTPGGEARDKWEAERARRINKPGAIQISIENMQAGIDGDRATVKFRQHYKSGALKTSANKTLALVRQDGRWMIQQERVGN